MQKNAVENRVREIHQFANATKRKEERLIRQNWAFVSQHGAATSSFSKPFA